MVKSVLKILQAHNHFHILHILDVSCHRKTTTKYVVLIFVYLFSGTQEQQEKSRALKKSKSIERSRYENSHYADDDDDNIVFEDFARLRLNEPDE